jgi:hypothetical protein
MKNIIKIAGALSLVIMVVLFSCKKDKDDPSQDGTTGTITGKIYAGNGTTTIPGVKIFVDVAGEIYFTKSNSSGSFSLDVPEGDHVLNIQAGNGKIFRAQIPVHVTKGQTTEVPASSCKLTQVAKLAHIAGAWDKIEDVIVALGYTSTLITVNDLSILDTLTNYSGIFLNCGKSDVLDSLKYDNLKQFVLGGGSLYASDYAVEYLTGDNNFKKQSRTRVAPKTNCVGEIGGFINDSTLCTDKLGYAGIVTGATVVDPDLATFIGANTLDIEYDLDAWEVVQQYTSPWEVLVSDATYGPLALKMDVVGGSSAFDKMTATDSAGTWITICHIPPGNPNNPITITINSNALSAHLAHGDNIGPCTGGSGGRIFFTTFHNDAAGNISSDVRKVLEYFIVNL